MDVCVKFDYSMLNSGPINQLFASQTNFTHFCSVFNCILRLPEVASDVISGVDVARSGTDVPVKFGDSGSNRA